MGQYYSHLHQWEGQRMFVWYHYEKRSMREMARSSCALLVAILCVIFPQMLLAEGTLSPNWRIPSKQLGYDVQYRVYLPAVRSQEIKLQTLYLVDGQWYLEYGEMISILDRLIREQKIEPVVVVFVDSRNPDDLTENRRNDQFMCNQHFADFFINELVPTIESNFSTTGQGSDRVVGGVSFGGLNAACFGLMLHQQLGGVLMQSPASARHVEKVAGLYKKSDRLPFKIFLSGGTQKDNISTIRSFKKILDSKGYPMKYIEVPHGHDWENWGALIDDFLLYFFASEGELTRSESPSFDSVQ